MPDKNGIGGPFPARKQSAGIGKVTHPRTMSARVGTHTGTQVKKGSKLANKKGLPHGR